MLAVSPLTITKDEKNQGGMELESFSTDVVDFGDLSEGNLLESINFDDLFSVDGDVLPDLEMFGEFSVSGGEESEINSSVENGGKVEKDNVRNVFAATAATTTTATSKKEDEDKTSSCGALGHDLGSNQGGVEIVSKRDESVVVSPSTKDGGKGRKSSAQSKNNNNNSQGKKKAKVDWTPELHRRFVQAVEQLGVDKAVPSRILEIMGIDCLTRHNIASHLQKYRSHRKHLLAREAESASWSQRRQLYGGGGKREVSPWLAPTMGFPPMTTTTMHHFRPLHVWGHPSMHMWPTHLPPHSPTPPPPLSWATAAAPPAPQDPSFWHAQQQRAPNALIPGTPCFPQPLTTTVTTHYIYTPLYNFGGMHVVLSFKFWILFTKDYRIQLLSYLIETTNTKLYSSIGSFTIEKIYAKITCRDLVFHRSPASHRMPCTKQIPASAHLVLDPSATSIRRFVVDKLRSALSTRLMSWSKESIDAAIGDVLSKPWLPLPLALKAPALDSVLSELQRQGIPNIPPSSA